MSFRHWIFVCLLWLPPQVHADYYLKIETSGNSLPYNTLLKNNGNAWLQLSIVEDHPLDGPIHYLGDRRGAEVSFRNHSGQYLKDVNVNYLRFYVAEVPRSLTLKKIAAEQVTTITAGAGSTTLTNAPALLFKDGLLVTTGVSFEMNTSNTAVSQSIYIAAGMPSPIVSYSAQGHGGGQFTPDTFPLLGPDLSLFSAKLFSTRPTTHCASGWQKGIIDGRSVELWQAAPDSSGVGCLSTLVYVGTISHAVRFE